MDNEQENRRAADERKPCRICGAPGREHLHSEWDCLVYLRQRIERLEAERG